MGRKFTILLGAWGAIDSPSARAEGWWFLNPRPTIGREVLARDLNTGGVHPVDVVGVP